MHILILKTLPEEIFGFSEQVKLDSSFYFCETTPLCKADS